MPRARDFRNRARDRTPSDDSEDDVVLSPADIRAIQAEVDERLQPIEDFLAPADVGSLPDSFLEVPAHLVDLQAILEPYSLLELYLSHTEIWRPTMIRMLRLRDSLSALEDNGPAGRAANQTFEMGPEGCPRAAVDGKLVEFYTREGLTNSFIAFNLGVSVKTAPSAHQAVQAELACRPKQHRRVLVPGYPQVQVRRR